MEKHERNSLTLSTAILILLAVLLLAMDGAVSPSFDLNWRRKEAWASSALPSLPEDGGDQAGNM